MSTEFVTGPHRVDHPHPDLAEGLADLWGRVTVAGGAVGFRPVDAREDVRQAAVGVLDDVVNRRAYLLTLGQDQVLVGAAVLTLRTVPTRRHTAELTWLMVDPALARQGWGQHLHDAVLAQARAVGLEKLDLCARGGQDLERFYESRGWIERGRWPNAVRIAEDDERDEIWFTRDL